MSIIKLDELLSLRGVAHIKEIFLKARNLNVANVSQIPPIPDEANKPKKFPMINSINAGDFSSRIALYTPTKSSLKCSNSLFQLKGRETFIQILSSDLKKDNSYTICRSANIVFSSEVVEILNNFGKIFLYFNFDSFDLKVGTDLKFKMVTLTPSELEAVRKESEQICEWNSQIIKVNNAVARLSYLINESEVCKC